MRILFLLTDFQMVTLMDFQTAIQMRSDSVTGFPMAIPMWLIFLTFMG